MDRLGKRGGRGEGEVWGRGQGTGGEAGGECGNVGEIRGEGLSGCIPSISVSTAVTTFAM